MVLENCQAVLKLLQRRFSIRPIVSTFFQAGNKSAQAFNDFPERALQLEQASLIHFVVPLLQRCSASTVCN
jgi:hypothetical protein